MTAPAPRLPADRARCHRHTRWLASCPDCTEARRPAEKETAK